MKKKVLIVDDDPDYLFQQKIHLESWGYEVIKASGQAEAENLLNTIKPDLAIIDLMMESEDSGFVLAYKIKNKYPGLPVIISTAVSAETGIRFDLESAGRKWMNADQYIEKGIKPLQLKKGIEKLLT